ncbi:MAG: tRNA (guanine-N7-)-methyltransferase [Gammaproteobacteria bacterium]|nr:MAG: tRNA (guanine-N7-)-methyltransferase [Gammaproteobacteria bacterium]TND02910.1 MAG: tRNA (guanine-N7-)-methyltransferase [Gammaproteobacteria bacterium]
MTDLPTRRTIRTIRSFVRREGRMTEAQRRALEQYWPRYGVDVAGPLKLAAIFDRPAPCIVEIGFGMGDTLIEMARCHPDNNYLGIEVYRPGIGSVLRQLDAADMHNVRVIAGDAMEVLRNALADASLDAIHVFFPDPWPKKRHHKRRIIQPDSVALFARKLRPGGLLHLATDWQEYAQHMLAVMTAEPALVNRAGDGGFSERPAYRPLTKFEQRGQRLGHQVRDLILERR